MPTVLPATSCFTPVATSRPGVFVCGAFGGPKDIPYSVMEASAASAAALVSLAESRDTPDPEEDLSGGSSGGG